MSALTTALGALRGSLVLVAGLGCRVDAVDGAAYFGTCCPRNACELGCAATASCIDGACVAPQTTYPLVFEVTPPTSSSFARGVTFTVPIADQTGSAERDLELDEPARVVSELDNMVPVTLRLRRVSGVPGAARSVFEASSFPASTVTPVMTIPTGDYEIFITPSRESDLAVLPPVQLRDDKTGGPLVQTFASGAQKLVISYASALRSIDVSLTDNAGAPLKKLVEARDVFIVDDTTGALASTVARTCVPGAKELASDLKLTLAPELTGHRYTLRVTPASTPCVTAGPPGPIATVDFDLQALDVEGRGNRAVLAMPVTSAILATGNVKAFGTNAAIADATVLLTSQKLDPSVDAKAGHASVQLRVEVGPSGVFFVQNALKGIYRAEVIPGSTPRFGSRPYAICVDCSVSAQDASAPPGSRVVEFTVDSVDKIRSLDFLLAPRVQVTFGAAGFDGALFGFGTYEADTSSSLALYTPAGSKMVTRSDSGALATTQEKGTGRTWNVAAALDPGVYDFVVRTPQASGYPWIVMPGIQVKPAPKLDLGVIKATAPVIFSGRVLDPTGQPVPRAAVRARAIVKASDPTKSPVGAVLVGESRADESGNYRIVVPSDFSTLAAVPAK